MFIKIHKSYRDVVAICDADLIGKTFEQGKFQLDCKETFYKSDETYNEKKAITIIQNYAKEDATFNIVGPNSVKTCIKAGIISQDSVKKIDNIPFALVLLWTPKFNKDDIMTTNGAINIF